MLSLGFMILGIGFVSFALFNKWTLSNMAIEVTPDRLLATDLLNPDYFTALTVGDASTTLDSSFAPVPSEILYSDYPQTGDTIGILTIPALKQEFSILQGTGNEELKKGVGHFIQSVLPGQEDNCVLSGHNDTVFSQIEKLVLGDLLIVETSEGIFFYEVSSTRIVDKDDKTVIVPTDAAVLTLTTCYPFITIGDAPDRYIVIANLIKNK
ncbi:MAG: class D sortase [Firmicutes bacterium HGW-Firmicutes-1]|nr:MAG: class D sortase [Firmicutes bacterium HGW-Firmicutes-1]